MFGQGISADEFRLMSINVVSESATALAYFSISLTLVYLIRKRRLPFSHMFWLIAAVIFACATARRLDVWAAWHPTYWTSVATAARAAAAAASLLAATLLYERVPGVLELKSSFTTRC
jgi:hypothetical protein